MLTPHFASNVNFPAPLAVLAFLAAVAGAILALASAAIAWFARKPKLARTCLLLVSGEAIVYLALLFGFSLASRTTILARDQEKHFCEIDCHLAYSILDVKPTDEQEADAGIADHAGIGAHVGTGAFARPASVASPSTQSPATNPSPTHYQITIRTRFDETTISPSRPKDATLTPSPRTICLVNNAGNQYLPTAIEGTPLLTPLKPADSYTTQLTFAVPSTINLKDLHLLIVTTPAWPDHAVIGDENSLLHKKTYFAL